jgi:hypothetical protein
MSVGWHAFAALFAKKPGLDFGRRESMAHSATVCLIR